MCPETGGPDLAEAVELESAADWHIRKLGENSAEPHAEPAAKLLQKLADEVRQLRAAPVYVEYVAILDWLGEFDVTEDFLERARDFRRRIGIDHHPASGEDYLRALIAIARDTAGV